MKKYRKLVIGALMVLALLGAGMATGIIPSDFGKLATLGGLIID